MSRSSVQDNKKLPPLTIDKGKMAITATIIDSKSDDFDEDVAVLALEEDVPRGRKRWVRCKFRLPAAVPAATAAATRPAASGARLRAILEADHSIGGDGGGGGCSGGRPIPFVPRFRFARLGEDSSLLATWSRDVRGPPRARWPRERFRVRGRGCRSCSRDGPTLWPRSSARWPPSHRTPALEPRRCRALLRAERRHDVLLARLRRGWISTSIAIRHSDGLSVRRGARVCELRRDLYTAVETRWHRSLSVQRVRTVSQDERNEQTVDQALETADRDQAAGTVLHELRDPHHHALEAQQRGRAGLQRVRPLLQAARGEQTAGDAEGRHTNAETQTEKDARTQRQTHRRGPRGYRRLDRFLAVQRTEEQPAAAAATTTATASAATAAAASAATTASNRGVEVVGGRVQLDGQTRLLGAHVAAGDRKRGHCEDGAPKLRRYRRATLFLVLPASSSSAGRVDQRAPATDLLREPGGALSSSASRDGGRKTVGVLVTRSSRHPRDETIIKNDVSNVRRRGTSVVQTYRKDIRCYRRRPSIWDFYSNHSSNTIRVLDCSNDARAFECSKYCADARLDADTVRIADYFWCSNTA